VKWVGYDNAKDNTWEPAEGMKKFPLLIAAFEESQKKAESTSDIIKSELDCKTLKRSSSETSSNDSFVEKVPENIVGVTRDDNNSLMVLIKWKNRDEASLISAEKAREICPIMLIQFYEDRLVFKSTPK
jgi:hypothetical protein